MILLFYLLTLYYKKRKYSEGAIKYIFNCIFFFHLSWLTPIFISYEYTNNFFYQNQFCISFYCCICFSGWLLKHRSDKNTNITDILVLFLSSWWHCNNRSNICGDRKKDRNVVDKKKLLIIKILKILIWNSRWIYMYWTFLSEKIVSFNVCPCVHIKNCSTNVVQNWHLKVFLDPN